MVRFEVISDRVARLRNLITRASLDAFVLVVEEGVNSESCRYISGFTGSRAVVIVDRKRTLLLSDGRYALQAKIESPFEFILCPKNNDIRTVIAESKYRRVGFEGDKIFYSSYKNFLTEIPFKLKDVSRILPSLRRQKGPEEVASIAAAAKISLEAFDEALKTVKIGMTEMEFSNLLLYLIKQHGGETGWTREKFVVASGERGAMPHASPSERKFVVGDIVTVDFGATVDGYMCDITKNFSIGKPSDRALKIFDILSEALQKSASELAPNKHCSDIDKAARRVIERSGYGQYFSHGLGHGIGLDIHESPRLSPSSAEVLTAGDIVAVEPGIYIDGWGGLRVEENYLITDDGSICLTKDEEHRGELKILDLGDS